jgi:hypothetical protein
VEEDQAYVQSGRSNLEDSKLLNRLCVIRLSLISDIQHLIKWQVHMSLPFISVVETETDHH